MASVPKVGNNLLLAILYYELYEVGTWTVAGCRGVLVVPACFGLPPLVQVIVGGGRTGKRGEPRSSARVRADSGKSAGPSPPGRSGPDQPTPAGAPGNLAVCVRVAFGVRPAGVLAAWRPYRLAIRWLPHPQILCSRSEVDTVASSRLDLIQII